MAFWNPFTWSFKRTSDVSEQRSSVGQSLTDATGELSKILGLHLDQVRVNATAAMNLSAFFGSVRVMSSLFSTLPVAHLEEKDGKRTKVKGEILTEVLTLRASRHVNAVDFKKALMANLLVYGNGVARIVKNKYRETEELIVYKFTDVTIIETDDRLFYHFPGGIVCEEEEVIHLKFLTLDGKIGIAPWGFAPKTFKVALSAQEFISKYYQNGTFLGGILSSDATLNDVQAKAAKQMWKDSTKQGVQNTGDIVVLGNGLKFHEIGTKPVESQMIEFFAKTDVDIYRMMGVPGHMMGDASQNNTWGGTGIESQFISFINIALLTYIQSFEQEIAYKCIRTDKRWAGQYVKMNLNNLLRPDAKTRWEIYRIAVTCGIMTQNEVLELEDRNGFDDGNDHWITQGFMKLDQADEILKLKTNGKKVTDPGSAGSGTPDA